jgi:hypothetical protein
MSVPLGPHPVPPGPPPSCGRPPPAPLRPTSAQWTTDVFGGWTLGAAWNAVLLTGWWTWFRRRANEAPAPEDGDITPSAPRPAY